MTTITFDLADFQRLFDFLNDALETHAHAEDTREGDALTIKCGTFGTVEFVVTGRVVADV